MGAEIPKIEKAKIALVNRHGEILVLTRSEEEDTRRGEDDWPGGTFDPGETDPKEVVLRDGGEELPGTAIDNVTPLYVHTKQPKTGEPVVSWLFAGTATFPEEGVALSREHSASRWVPHLEFPGQVTMPGKYITAVTEGGPIIAKMAMLAQIAEAEARAASGFGLPA